MCNVGRSIVFMVARNIIAYIMVWNQKGHGSIDLTQERSIKLVEKSEIPADILGSDLALQSYLEENVRENQKHERIRLRVAKAQRTRINHSLEAAARKIKVEPAGPGTAPEIKRVDICKEPREGSLVVEQRKGLVVNCNHCNHIWTHFSKNLYGQYYASCPKCHGNCRLKHYKVG
jgi:hypothetical protein